MITNHSLSANGNQMMRVEGEIRPRILDYLQWLIDVVVASPVGFNVLCGAQSVAAVYWTGRTKGI